MARSSSRRGGLLLLELAFDEPEHQNGVEAFPLLMGVGRRLGWPVAWLTLGVRYEPAMLYRLASGDLRVLLGETARTRPRAVIVSARLDERQRRRLESAGARVLICPIDEGAVDELPRFIKTALPEACRPWLDDPRLFDRLDPDYRRRPLNRAPWTRRAIICVVAGMRCSYLSRAAENPFYRRLPEAGRALRCSFCGMRSMRMPLQDELAYAVRHVESACRQRRGEGGERRFELVGSRLWPGIETLVDALARAGVRGAELNFMPRVDELLARRDAVVRCLPVLTRQGLALRLYGMGVENFSPAENMRLNKGVAAGQVHEAAGFMRETAERWPRQFRLPSGGLSMILFTPWTTIEDLLINIHHIERCPLIDRSFAIGRRLQLFPGLPITALAAKDGLLAAADEPFYNSGCITSADRKEIPWRFRRPEVEVLWRLARRLSSNHGGVPADDPERRRIDALLAGRRRPLTEDRRDPFTVFRRAVEIAASWTGSRRRRRRALSPGPPGNGMMS